MLLLFSFSCGIFNIKLGNVWNLLGSGLFWLNFGMCWQGLGSLVLRVVIYGNSRYKLFSISCWKNSSMNLAIQLQMCACHLDLASIWFYLGWGIPPQKKKPWVSVLKWSDVGWFGYPNLGNLLFMIVYVYVSFAPGITATWSSFRRFPSHAAAGMPALLGVPLLEWAQGLLMDSDSL